MQINGYKVREILKRYDLRKKTLISEFEDCLHAFEGEEKPKPTELMNVLRETSEAVAFLQEFQEWFNNQIRVNFEGQEITLSLAIKLIGGIDCMEKLWRKANAKPKDLWGRGRGNVAALTRSKEHEYALKTYTAKEAVDAADVLASRANTLRALIAHANAHDITVTARHAQLEKLV